MWNVSEWPRVVPHWWNPALCEYGSPIVDNNNFTGNLIKCVSASERQRSSFGAKSPRQWWLLAHRLFFSDYKVGIIKKIYCRRTRLGMGILFYSFIYLIGRGLCASVLVLLSVNTALETSHMRDSGVHCLTAPSHLVCHHPKWMKWEDICTAFVFI